MKRKGTLLLLALSLLLLSSCMLPESDTPMTYTVKYYDSYGNLFREYTDLKFESKIPVPEEVPSYPDPFKGWQYYNLDENGNPDFSYHATLTKDEDGDYKVIYNICGFPIPHGYSHVSYDYVFEEDLGNAQSSWESVEEFKQITFPNPPTVNNFEFEGWYLDKELSQRVEEPIIAGDDQSIKIYGYYKATVPIYTISYSNNEFESKKVLKGDTLYYHGKPNVDGVFVDWYLDPEYLKKADPNLVVTSDITLYARSVEKREVIDKIGKFYLFNTGELVTNGEYNNTSKGYGSVLETHYYHYYFMEQDGYYTGRITSGNFKSYPSGIKRVIDSSYFVGEYSDHHVVLLDSYGQIFIMGEFNNSTYSDFTLLTAFKGNDDEKAIRIDTNEEAIAILTDKGNLYIYGTITNTTPYLSYETLSLYQSDVVDFALSSGFLLYVTKDGALVHRGVDLGTLNVDNTTIESSGVTSIYASKNGNSHNEFILYSKDGDVYVLGKYKINEGPVTYTVPTLLFENYVRVANFTPNPALFDRDGNLYILGSLEEIQEDYVLTLDEPYHVLPDIKFKGAETVANGTYALAENGDLYYFGKKGPSYNSITPPTVVRNNIKMLSNNCIVDNDNKVYEINNYGWTDDYYATLESNPVDIQGDYFLLENGKLTRYESPTSQVSTSNIVKFFYQDYPNGYLAKVGDRNSTYPFYSPFAEQPYSFSDNIVKVVAVDVIEFVLLETGEVYFRLTVGSDLLEPMYTKQEAAQFAGRFTKLNTNYKFKDISAIQYDIGAVALLTDNGSVYVLGSKDAIEGGCYIVGDFYRPKDLSNVTIDYFVGDNYYIGKDKIYHLGSYGFETYDKVPGKITKISEFGHKVCLTEEGDIYTWGRNIYGECGNGESAFPTTPVLVDIASWSF